MEIFWRTIAYYNSATWLLQIVIILIGIASVSYTHLDISHPVRRELHRQYIRQCLNNFADNSNVIQLTSAEFTGPLHLSLIHI